MDRKKFGALLAALTVSVGALAGCGSNAASSGSGSGDVSSDAVSSVPSSSAVASNPVSSSAAPEPEQTPVATVQLKEGESLQNIVNAIEEQIGIAMPGEIDETVLGDVFYLAPEDVTEYYGKFSMVMVSADNVVAVKAAEGKVEAVQEALTRRLEDVRLSFEQYLPDQYEKSQKGQVYTKGDYVFLLVLGQGVDTFDSDMEKAMEIVDGAFS